jgi:hypothetical protein
MKHTEDDMQRQLMAWMRRTYPNHADWMHHSPNGGQRNAATGARLKAAGTRRGFPDVCWYIRRGEFSGLAIELKALGGRVTNEQTQWLDHLASEGWLTALCFSLTAAQETINAYFAQGGEDG